MRGCKVSHCEAQYQNERRESQGSLRPCMAPTRPPLLPAVVGQWRGMSSTRGLTTPECSRGICPGVMVPREGQGPVRKRDLLRGFRKCDQGCFPPFRHVLAIKLQHRHLLWTLCLRI